MMSRLAFIAIVFGAMIFALGLMPNAQCHLHLDG
jgi:hypothetical protein